VPAVVLPATGSDPIGLSRLPATLSPCCVSFRFTVVDPCGALRVTSQTPVTLPCVRTGAARNITTTANASTRVKNLMKRLLPVETDRISR
jgi:hypothetical protein